MGYAALRNEFYFDVQFNRMQTMAIVIVNNGSPDDRGLESYR